MATNEGNPSNENYKLLKLYLTTIPEFDGNSRTLPIFLNSCDHLVTLFQSSPALVDFLFRSFLARLRGRAQILLSQYPTSNWADAKQLLTTHFSDKRSLTYLSQALTKTYLRPGEDLRRFGSRCHNLLAGITSNIMADLTLTTEEKALRLEFYEDLALKTYLTNLPRDLHLALKIKAPKTLQSAISLSREEEDILKTPYFANSNSFSSPRGKSNFHSGPRQQSSSYPHKPLPKTQTTPMDISSGTSRKSKSTPMEIAPSNNSRLFFQKLDNPQDSFLGEGNSPPNNPC